MGRKPLTDEEIEARLFAKLAAKTGKTYTPTDSAAVAESSRQAEAVSDLLTRPDKYTYRNCRHCGEKFAFNYPAVVYCEDSCRKAHLRQMGILWHPEKSAEQRWGSSGVPLVVPPAALRALRLALSVEPTSDADRQ